MPALRHGVLTNSVTVNAPIVERGDFNAPCAEHLILLVVAASIGVVGAWAMRWADALWLAFLFHMGLDLVVVFGLVESL